LSNEYTQKCTIQYFVTPLYTEQPVLTHQCATAQSNCKTFDTMLHYIFARTSMLDTTLALSVDKAALENRRPVVCTGGSRT